MKNLGALLVAAGLALLPGRTARAQQAIVVSGTVRSEANAPILGASVGIMSLGVGAMTNEAGHYSFIVPADRVNGQAATLVVRRIGFRQASAQITLVAGAVTQDFTLAAAPAQLEEVVTTALGIEKSKKSLGYAQQSVDTTELNRTRSMNIANSLEGKVAGLQVTGATTQGGSARVVIRGASSISQGNEPLYVVDGIPINNSNFNGNSQGYGGYDYGNAAQDINPDDIADVSVLKGPTAAALYGSRAANGAILITTKNGRGTNGFTWSASNNTTFDSAMRLPEYQNTWGQGYGGALCDTMSNKNSPAYAECGFSYVDGNYNGVNDGVDESWGPRLDGRPRMQYSTTTAGGAELRPWIAHPNNVRDFFETGRTTISNVATQGANDRANFRLSFTNQELTGIVPNSSLRRLTGSLNAGAKVTSRLSTSGDISYTKNSGQNRPGTGYDEANPMMGFVWFGRQVDVAGLKKHYVDAKGNQISWNYSYHNNPAWNQYMNSNRDDRDRVIGSAQATYTFMPWLKLMGRSGTDFYRDFRAHNVAAGWIGGLFDGNYSKGGFQENTRFNRETNSDLLLTATGSLLDGRFGIKTDLGANRRNVQYRANAFGTDELIIPGTYNIGNSAKPVTPGEYLSQRQTNSVFGQADLSFNDYLFLNLSGRNDWSSTLPKGNNSYFYPAASLGFVFTEAVPMLTFGDVLRYGKLRAGWSSVGNDVEGAYQTSLTFSPSTSFGKVGRFPVNNVLPGLHLQPERTYGAEVGTELQFLDNRLSLDATYYTKETVNQILYADVSRASGFTQQLLNAGSVTNKGIEAQIKATPVRLGNGFEWNTMVNFGSNKSRVVSLPGELQTVVLGSHWGATVEARLGEPYGAIYGTTFKRNAQGELLLRNGLPQKAANKAVLGHYPPDWTGSISNELRFRGVDFSFMFDTRQGGQIYSTGNMWGAYAGVLKETEYRPASGIVIKGVDEATGQPNTRARQTEDYYHSLWQIQERWVYDASFVKFREARLGFSVPKHLSEMAQLGGIKVAIVGRNLALWSKAPNIDPETAFASSNFQGFEMGQLPSTRSIGFSISVTP